jgi:hypothetical protein
VRSTSTPPSPCRILTFANVPASPIQGTLKHTVMVPLMAAVVVTS